MFEIGQLTRLPLGYVGENGTRTISIDMKAWLDEYPGALIMIQVIRPVDHYKYPAAYTKTDGVIHWTVDGAEVMYAGKGIAQIALYNPDTKQEYKSRVVGTIVAESLDGFNDIMLEETDPASKWVNRVLEAAESAEASKNDAANSKEEAAAAVAIVSMQKNEALIAIQNEGAAQVVSVNEAGTQQAQFVEAKGEEVLGKIPEDYTELSKNVATLTKEIERNTAPPIIPTATGEVVTISDSANRPLAGLQLYGKTTQDGVPSPNNRVPMVNAGDGGNIETIITAKNRFDFDGWKASCVPTRANVGFGEESVTITAMEDDAFVVSEIKVPVVGGKTYTITFNVSDDNIFKTNYLFKNGVVDDSLHVHYGTKYTFTADADAQFYTVRFGIPDAGNTVTFSDIMFVEGVDVLPYEPGVPMQIINVSTPGGLRGNPVPTGGTYTDETGKQWVCDEVDLGRGVRVQRISRVVGNDTNAVFVQPGMWYINGVIASTVGGRLGVLASHYKAYSTNEAQHGNVCVNGLGMIVFGNEAYTDEATMRANLAQNPVTVDYILTSPIETPLTADELAAFRAMTSNKPSTVVYNDAGAGMAVDYIADTKNYIDGKLAAIAAATL